MHYIITAFVLVAGLAPVCAQEQVNTSSSTRQGAPIGGQNTSKYDVRAHDTEEIKQLQAQLDQSSQNFGAKQIEDRTAFLKSISSKKPKEQRKLLNSFQEKQAVEKSAFAKERRSKGYEISVKRHEANMAAQKKELDAKNMPEASKKAYMDQLDKSIRENMETRYKRMEADEAELDKVRNDYGLKPEKRRKKLEELSKTLAEKHNKDDKAKNEKQAKQLEEQMRKAQAQQRQSTAAAQQ